MNNISIDSLLRSIKNDLAQIVSINEISDLSKLKTVESRIIEDINKFEQDPSILDKYLSVYINTVTKRSLDLLKSNELNDLRLLTTLSKIFYNFAKLFTWKKLSTLLKPDIILLNDILKILHLNKDKEKEQDEIWYVDFYLLSWLYIILLSPFSFKQNEIDITVIDLILSRKFNENNVYLPIVSNIVSELYYKNKSLLLNFLVDDTFKNTSYDLLSLNYFFKKTIQNINARENNVFLTENQDPINKTIIKSLSYWNEKDDNTKDEQFSLIMIKIIPKFFYIELYYENWSQLEDIISWYLLNLDSQFIEFRFSLAVSFKKLINLISDTMEIDIAIQLIEERIDQTVELVRQKMNEVNINELHSNLLIIAQLSDFIINNLASEYLFKIVEHIIPITCKFQKLNHMDHVSQRSNQIKDATNFICWSLIRNKNLKKIWPQDKKLEEIFHRNIFINLLMNSLFDKDFIIRKSSNAALQEFLGRLRGSSNTLEIDNATVLKLIELKYNDLNISYNTNLGMLSKIFMGPENWFHDVLEWLIKFNILQNIDLQIVKLSIESLKNFVSKHTEFDINKIIWEILKDLKNYNNSLQCARLLYLSIELEPFIDIEHSFLSNISEKVINGTFHTTKNIIDFFKFLSILNFWKFLMAKSHIFSFNVPKIEFFFKQIVNSIPNKDSCIWYQDFNEIINDLIEIISNDHSNSYFENESANNYFWILFEKYIKFNNILISSSLPKLRTSDFLSKFDQHKYSLSCQCKAEVIKTINEDSTGFIIRKLFSEKTDSKISFIQLMKSFLDDHTVTDQGDIGRLVRYQACLLINRHFDELPKDSLDDFAIQLLYLLAEPSGEISHLSFKILKMKFTPQVKDELSSSSYDLSILKLRDIFLSNKKIPTVLLKQYNVDFWKHYALRAGAIHSTDDQIRSAIDGFIIWYNETITNPEEIIILFHNLVNSIPSANSILQMRKEANQVSIIKSAIVSINFIIRLISSRVTLKSNNWDGLLIKVHNLLILKGSTALKNSSVQLLPYLAIAYASSETKIQDFSFINSIIDKLFYVLKKCYEEKNVILQKIALQGLFQLLLEFNKMAEVQSLQTILKYNPLMKDINHSKFYIHD